VPLLRYDLPLNERLRGIQRIHPSGQKRFTRDFGKNGSSLRLGDADLSTRLILVCEGYATGLSIRQAIDRRYPVFVALDAYNLATVVPMLRSMFTARLLVCADDDWLSTDHEGPNPGRRRAMAIAKQTEACDIVVPIFRPSTRQSGDTDFNDLHMRQGLNSVMAQLWAVIDAMRRAGRV